ncbi:hypothetical protein BASA50_008245 [Batrachochytrium salamandrivorans]|uniref:UDP-glucose 4-epimerase n=1 Tax=Batrachochytrium salamandrivorans TaxID=1357716 RepID=A0ABQ8F4K2_9FUNG|nr:hypothetical protein BASA60_008954 [Batrachochytrium salamandrivorans]KAH6592099.1 hypothetical protein BASA50_008245 [Batrachochytrium salamandrivorans]KAH6599896.1 hypothetical protein BASA61_002447 [Batrachochytrium salamandrivorans]KAH9269063.1 UDP-glucose 4-epimerase GalE [Batrachochytrium salamandrivorans]
MKVLVCGGAGYIGSHLVREITKLPDYEVVVFDNMTKGHSVAVPAGIKLVRGDIRNQDDLESIFLSFKPDAVFHFSASIEVGESCADPLKYYDNNVCGTVKLLQVMQKHGTKFFVFSSTAALFGMPDRVPIHEFDTAVPKNPYGDTKLAVETMLKWCDEAWGLKNVCLRYFNACGADASGDIGEDHQPESHLIPIVLQVPRGMREKVFINGSDYNTPDGTCVRDYIHVTDLATAHIKALQHIVKTNTSDKFNLGSGKGYSVKEIINAARKVTGHPIPADLTDRRPGDPDTLIAASDRAETILGWKRQYNTIEEIVATAWNFHQKHPNGLDH